MKIVGIRGSVKAVRPIAKGFEALGDSYELAESVDSPIVNEADAFLQTNELKPKFVTVGRNGPYEYILKSGRPYLVQESPNFRKYLDLGYQRLGWYSYKWGSGIFGNKNSPPDRWRKFQAETGIEIKPWKSPGDKIILMGQKNGDSSLTRLYDRGLTLLDWMQQTVNDIRKHTDRHIIIRPHPCGLSKGLGVAESIKGTNISISENITRGGAQGGAGLDADLSQAWCVVTYNSLSAVESVCDGIPTFTTDDGSMAWPVTHHDFREIENLRYDFDIDQWCNDIAYTQWNASEFASGECWAHLKPLIFPNP